MTDSYPPCCMDEDLMPGGLDHAGVDPSDMCRDCPIIAGTRPATLPDLED